MAWERRRCFDAVGEGALSARGVVRCREFIAAPIGGRLAHYGIINVTPTSEDWIPAYIEAVGPLIAKHGGKFLARTASHERIEGNGPNPAIWAIVEFPSKEALDAFYSDPDYQAPLQARLAGSESNDFSVAGQDDFAS